MTRSSTTPSAFTRRGRGDEGADERLCSPASSINPDHLLFYRFVGRVIAKSVYDGRTIPAYFSQSLYKQILGKPVEVSDLESIDPEGHRSLRWILDNPIDEAMLDLTFSTEADVFGVSEVIDLKPGGRKIAVVRRAGRSDVLDRRLMR